MAKMTAITQSGSIPMCIWACFLAICGSTHVLTNKLNSGLQTDKLNWPCSLNVKKKKGGRVGECHTSLFGMQFLGMQVRLGENLEPQPLSNVNFRQDVHTCRIW